MNTTLFASPPVYRISVDEYERMAGILDDDRVELIDGFLVKKMGKNPPHVWSTDAIMELLKTMTRGYWCRQEAPVRIPDFDEPEPDVSIVRGSRDDYRDRIPAATDVALLVEVSETTLDRDQGPKWDAYARGASRCTGSSTWSIARSRSTPTPAWTVIATCRDLLGRPADSGRARRRRSRPDRRGRHPPLTGGAAKIEIVEAWRRVGRAATGRGEAHHARSWRSVGLTMPSIVRPTLRPIAALPR